MAIITPLTSRFNALRSYAGNVAWGPLVTLSRSAVMAVLLRMRQGRLDIVDVDGKETLCGRAENPAGAPRTTLRVHRDAFWVRMMLFADMVCLVSAAVNQRIDSGANQDIRASQKAIC